MAPKLSKFYGVKRDEKARILTSYMQARQRTKLKKEALQAVADEYGFAFSKVKTLVYRYNPEKEAHIRLHKRNSLTFEQEARAVGIILGMANIAKPLSIKGFLSIMKNLHKGEKATFGRKWFSGFQARWSKHITRSKGELISAGRSNPENLQSVEKFIDFLDDYEPRIGAPAHATFNVDETRVSINEAKRGGARLVAKAYRKSGTRGKREKQHCSIVPFVSAAGEVISVFYVLASRAGQKVVSVPRFASTRDHTPYRQYFLITDNGYTNNEIFPVMVEQFEKDFHVLYPGLRALVYLDRLGSHTTKRLLKTIEGKMVSLVLFPAGTTQFLQPLDDAVFALFKTKLRMHRDELLTANPLNTLMAQQTLLKAMMLALRESLVPGPIKASFRNTGIYPWNPEKIRATARLAYPDLNYVDEELPDETQQVVAAIQAASPQGELVVLSEFRRHRLEQGRTYTIQELDAEEDAYLAEKAAEAAEKREKAKARAEAAAERLRKKQEKQQQREAARAARKRQLDANQAAKAKRLRQSKCYYCSSSWKGSQLWLWCEQCDDCGICPTCLKDPDTKSLFDRHELEHNNQ